LEIVAASATGAIATARPAVSTTNAPRASAIRKLAW
jgi:hypothetical protein